MENHWKILFFAESVKMKLQLIHIIIALAAAVDKPGGKSMD